MAARATLEIVALLRDGVTQPLRGIQSSLRSTFSGLRGLLGVGVGGGFAFAVKSIADMQTSILRMARTARSSVEDVSALKFALSDLGIGGDQLASILNQIEGKRSDALRGGGNARTAFGRLGIDLADLKSLGAVELLRQLSQGFVDAGQSATAAAQLQAIFGDRFRELLPLLSQGSQGFAELRERAASVNAVLGTADAENAERFTKAYTEFASLASGVFRDLANTFLPAITEALQKVRILLAKFGIGSAEPSRADLREAIKRLEASQQGEAIPNLSDSVRGAIAAAGGSFEGFQEGTVVFNRAETIDKLKSMLADMQAYADANPIRPRVDSDDGDKTTFFQGFRAEIDATREQLEDMFRAGGEAARGLQDAGVNNLTRVLREVRTGAIETKDALSSMLDGFIEDLTELATRRLAEQLFNSILGFFGAAGGGGGIGGAATGGRAGAIGGRQAGAIGGIGAGAGAGAFGVGGRGRKQLFGGPSSFGAGGGGTIINITSVQTAEEQQRQVSSIMQLEAQRNRKVRVAYRIV